MKEYNNIKIQFPEYLKPEGEHMPMENITLLIIAVMIHMKKDEKTIINLIHKEFEITKQLARIGLKITKDMIEAKEIKIISEGKILIAELDDN